MVKGKATAKGFMRTPNIEAAAATSSVIAERCC
jgi:hypothetical protein